MCLGSWMYFSMNILPSPKAEIAASLESLYLSVASWSFQAIIIPIPPPPAEAFIMTGYPISFEILSTYSTVSTSPTYPGTVLTFASLASFLDSILSPIA